MFSIKYIISLILFYCLHSLLASENIKSLFSRKLGLLGQGYRLFFNLISVITSVMVVGIFFDTIGAHFFEPMSIVGYGLIACGAFLVLWSLRGYGLMAFLGLKKESSKDTLVIKGLNSYTRHPLYLGVLVGLIGLSLVWPISNSIATLIITYIYVLVGIRLEERKLIQQYGRSYKDYQQSVGMLWPRRK